MGCCPNRDLVATPPYDEIDELVFRDVGAEREALCAAERMVHGAERMAHGAWRIEHSAWRMAQRTERPSEIRSAPFLRKI